MPAKSRSKSIRRTPKPALGAGLAAHDAQASRSHAAVIGRDLLANQGILLGDTVFVSNAGAVVDGARKQVVFHTLGLENQPHTVYRAGNLRHSFGAPGPFDVVVGPYTFGGAALAGTPTQQLGDNAAKPEIRSRIKHAVKFLEQQQAAGSAIAPPAMAVCQVLLPQPLIEKATAETGIRDVSSLTAIALAFLLTPQFGQWLVENSGKLPKDFELDV